MGLSAAVGSINTGTGAIGSTVVVSGLGFQPKVIFFWWSGRTETTDTAGRANEQRGFGVAVSTTLRFYCTSLSQDTPTVMVTNRMQGNAQCIGLTTTADAIDGLMDLQSMDSGGFTLVVDDVFVADYRVHYLALGGTDIVSVTTNAFTKIDVTGTQDITSLAFQPNFVLLVADGQQTNNNSVSVDSPFIMGVATASGTGNQYVYIGGSNDASTTSQTFSYCFDAECIGFPNSAVNAIESRAEFTSFLSNGFRINWLVNVAAAKIVNFVAIQFTDTTYVKLGDLLTQTDTVTGIAESGFGFSPVAAMFVSHTKSKSTAGTIQDDDEWTCGAFSSTTARAAMGTADDDAAPTAVVGTAVEHDEVYANLAAATGSIEGLMDVSTVDSDGFTCIMDDADPTQAFVWYVAFGVPAAPTGHPASRRVEHVPYSRLPGTGRLP